jgi:hypothetical protein
MSLSPAKDQDGNPLILSVTGITSDEATATDKGSGGAQHSPDATIGKDGAFRLRAERSGNGNGRVYQVTFTAENTATKEVSTGSVTVCVPQDKGKGCTCRDDGQKYDATKKN